MLYGWRPWRQHCMDSLDLLSSFLFLLPILILSSAHFLSSARLTLSCSVRLGGPAMAEAAKCVPMREGRARRDRKKEKNKRAPPVVTMRLTLVASGNGERDSVQ